MYDYDYEQFSCHEVSDTIKFHRHFKFMEVLQRYQDNITLNKKLEERLINNKINGDEYKSLNEMLDACVFHFNQTLEFNKKNNTKLNHHYIIKYNSNIFSSSLGYDIIDEKDFHKCNIFLK